MAETVKIRRADEIVPSRLYVSTVFGDPEGEEWLTFLWFQGRVDGKALTKDIRIEIEFDPQRNVDVAEVLQTLLKKDRRHAYIDFDEFVRKYVTVSRSPPKGKRMAEVMKGSHVVIGTVVGLQAAAGIGDMRFAFATVPTGILIIGAAAGISEGLREGLAKRVRSWLK